MGGSASKRIEEKLEQFGSYEAAVKASFEECMALTEHKYPGLQAYQMLDAANKVYEKILKIEDEKVISFREKWLPNAPTQMDVDKTMQRGSYFQGGKEMELKEFREFCGALFTEMTVGNALQNLAVSGPTAGAAVMVAHVVVKRLPIVGGFYAAVGPLGPLLLLGTAVGYVFLQMNADA